MVNVFAYGLAGATEGLGNGIVAQAEAKRIAALELARNQREDKQRAEDRKNDLADRADSRSYDAGVRAEGRSYEEGIAGAERGRVEARRGEVANVYESLFGTESSNNFDAYNDEGYNGRSQFGQARLDDWSAANGSPRLNLEEFRKNPELQKEVEKWHFGDINAYIDKNDFAKYDGQTIDGVEMSRSGMVAMAHLGGKGGLTEFLKTNGKYNPSDSNGTSLADYARKHGGLPTDMSGVWDVLADENTPESVRDDIRAGIENPGNGIGAALAKDKDKNTTLTNQIWLDLGDGTERAMGTNNKTGRISPWLDDDGKEVTRPIKATAAQTAAATAAAKPKTLTKVTRDELIARFPDEKEGGPNYATIDALSVEIERLMVEEGMSEVQAKNDAISRMDYASTVTPAKPASVTNWWADAETTSDPVFTGNFKERGWANPPAKGSTNQPTGGETVSPPPADAATQSTTATTANSGAALQQARDAIAAGASREAVVARLIENGIDPKGL
jgi:hypothetical protein